MLTQNIPVGQTPPEDPAYVAEMIKKGGGETEPEPQGSEEKLLAGKYKSAEELEKAYKELEKKLGQRPNPSTADVPPVAPDTESTPNEGEGENKDKENTDTTPKGFEPFFEEFERDGKLSDDSYKALSDMGLPKEVVDSYIEGQKALAASKAQSVYSVVGGEAEYNSMIAWAAANLKESQKIAYNDAINSGDPEVVAIAVKGLAADYRAAKGTPPKMLIDGTENTTTSGDVFRSTAELTAAMSDPRYQRDPAYRKEVEEKLFRSDIL